MPQELKGRLTVLCPACREGAPRPIGTALEWSCPHRNTTVLETRTHRFFTMGHASCEGYERHITTII